MGELNVVNHEIPWQFRQERFLGRIQPLPGVENPRKRRIIQVRRWCLIKSDRLVMVAEY